VRYTVTVLFDVADICMCNVYVSCLGIRTETAKMAESGVCVVDVMISITVYELFQFVCILLGRIARTAYRCSLYLRMP